MEVDVKKLSLQVQQIDGDIYLMTKTIETMNENIKDLVSKYELLLNRVKCAECNLRNKEDHDPSTDLMA